MRTPLTSPLLYVGLMAFGESTIIIKTTLIQHVHYVMTVFEHLQDDLTVNGQWCHSNIYAS